MPRKFGKQITEEAETYNSYHGVFIDSGHYVSYIRQRNKWYHCDDKHITETNLLTLSNNVYLMFYAKEVDLGT